MPISNDLINQKKTELRQKLHDALASANPEDIINAMMSLGEDIEQRVCKEYEEMGQERDEQVLAARGKRLLTAEELTNVYLNEMRRDFPAGELKPLSMILNSEAAGTAHTWGVYEDDALVAYLLMVRPVGCEVSQLDYFAVLPQYRAGGIGAALLAALPDHEKGAQAILIEAECPEKAEDEAMAVRRLGFYARCGAKDTGWTEHLFDAWFRVLVLPCCGGKVRSPEEAVRQLADCYRRTMGEPQWRRNVTFYRPDGVEVEL